MQQPDDVNFPLVTRKKKLDALQLLDSHLFTVRGKHDTGTMAACHPQAERHKQLAMVVYQQCQQRTIIKAPVLRHAIACCRCLPF
jgi:hypothetical protein